MTERPTVSVLLPIHAGIVPDHLLSALASLDAQTRPPDEVVLVEDGPLLPDHRRVIDRWIEQAQFPVVVVALEQNSGAGIANGVGLARASGEWIAKADADDLNAPDRIERQLSFVLEAGVDVCGTAMEEFAGSPDNVTAVRRNPSEQSAIARRMRINSPVNHPTAFYRRAAAVRVGGYSDLRFMQDYDMWARMLVAGSTFANMSDPLVKFRADDGMYRRRTSRAMNHCEWILQHNLRGYGLTSTPRMWTNLGLRMLFRRLPPPILKFAYKLLLHGRREVA